MLSSLVLTLAEIQFDTDAVSSTLSSNGIDINDRKTIFIFVGAVVAMLIVILVIISTGWTIFSKADQYGIAFLIPIWREVVTARIAGYHPAVGLLLLIPCVSPIVAIMLIFGIAKRFDHGPVYALCLLLFPYLFFPIMAFGDSEYIGAELDAARDGTPNQGNRKVVRRRDDDDE